MAKVLVKVWPQVSTFNLVLDIILYVSFKDAARVRVVVLRCVLLCMEAKSQGRDYINVGVDFLIRFYFLTCLHFPAFHSFILSLKMQEQS